MNISDNSLNVEEANKENKRFYSGLTLFPNIKRTWHLCPRCCHKEKRFTVDKTKRKCMACGGRLYWPGDDCHISDIEHEDYFVWHTSLGGLQGWYHRSYWHQ